MYRQTRAISRETRAISRETRAMSRETRAILEKDLLSSLTDGRSVGRSVGRVCVFVRNSVRFG